jgi:hypothetical protein
MASISHWAAWIFRLMNLSSGRGAALDAVDVVAADHQRRGAGIVHQHLVAAVVLPLDERVGLHGSLLASAKTAPGRIQRPKPFHDSWISSIE